MFRFRRYKYWFQTQIEANFKMNKSKWIFMIIYESFAMFNVAEFSKL